MAGVVMAIVGKRASQLLCAVRDRQVNGLVGARGSGVEEGIAFAALVVGKQPLGRLEVLASLLVKPHSQDPIALSATRDGRQGRRVGAGALGPARGRPPQRPQKGPKGWRHGRRGSGRMTSPRREGGFLVMG